MKLATRIIATTFTLASLATATVVLAHPGQGMGMGMGMMGQGMGMGAGMAGHPHGPQNAATAATHLGELKAQLKITAAQEPAWQKFEASARQQAEAGQALRTAMQAQMQTHMHSQLNDPKAAPVDHTAQHEAMSKLRDSHLAARKELYAVLTPEQKLIADQHMGAGRGHRMAMQAPAK